MKDETVKPPALKAGDNVGLVAPASPLLDYADIHRAEQVLEGMGFRVKTGKFVRRRYGFLAGSDRERAEDLNAMFADREVKGVFGLRGGYGSGRLLELVDWDLVAENPKVLIGHSDLTALLTAINQRTGLVTFWGPLAGYDMGRHSSRFKTRWLRKVICGDDETLRLPAGPLSRRRRIRVISPGRVEGRLTGGNLSIIASLIGTPFEIDTAGKIFFFEDVDEEPYRIDRMLNQLSLAGKLQAAAGIVVGRCVNCESSGRMKRSFRLREVLDGWLAPLGIPVLYGFPFGHEPDKITLPVGVRARIASQPPSLTLLEAAVTRKP